MNLQELFEHNCSTPSDINEHLPTLKSYYDQCESVTEFGVRGCVSLSAALVSNAKKVVAYDIMNVVVPECEKLTFIQGNTLEVEIEPTDFLFVDSLHTYGQLKAELERHHAKVNKYIGFHDTHMFGLNGEDGGEGLMQAVNEFLFSNEDWVMEYQTSANNGLTIIKRI